MHINSAERNNAIQGSAGGKERKADDQGGHLIPTRLDGPPVPQNVYAQNGRLNQSEIKKVENAEYKILNDNPSSSIHTERIAYSHSVSEDGIRPEAFIINDTVNYGNGNSQDIHLSFSNIHPKEQNQLNRYLEDVIDIETVPEEGNNDVLRSRMSPKEYADLMEDTDVELSSIRDEFREHISVGSSSYKVHLDKRETPEDMVEQLASVTKDVPSEGIEDMTSEVDDAELKYLDENTIAEEGLTRIEDEQDEDGKKHEDRLRPIGNQEDSGGKNHPDSWSNPTELKEGSLYFQVSPILNDGTSETKSSYFTDEKTINSCKDANGVISVSALLQKLQIEPKKETIIDENGNVKEEYVKKYMLSSFMYTGSADK